MKMNRQLYRFQLVNQVPEVESLFACLSCSDVLGFS